MIDDLDPAGRLLCEVFKSPVRDETYLYVSKREGLERVPAALLKTFGRPQSVLTMLLSQTRRLAREDPVTVLANIRARGFHLQVAPPPPNLLEEFRGAQ